MKDGEPTETQAFARGFLAVRYLLGARGSELTMPSHETCHVDEPLHRALTCKDQPTRARALAICLGTLREELQRRRLDL